MSLEYALEPGDACIGLSFPCSCILRGSTAVYICPVLLFVNATQQFRSHPFRLVHSTFDLFNWSMLIG